MNRALAWSLAANLVLVGAGAVMLFRRSGAADASLLRERMYGEERMSHLRTLQPARGAIVFLGDSLTERCEWAELLGDGRVVNRGVAGDTTEQARARVDTWLASRPGRVFVMLGTNDLAAGDDIARIAEHYALLLDALGTTAVVQSVPPVRGSSGALSNERVRALNEHLRELARGRGLGFVDVHGALVDSSGQLDARFTLDGVHLNGDGYSAWARLLEHHMR